MYTEPSTAISYFRRALVLAEELGSDHVQGVFLSHLGNANLLAKQFDEAKECFQKALKIAEERNDYGRIGNRLGNLGNAIQQQAYADIKSAIVYFHRSRGIARRLGNKLSEANRLMNLGGAYASVGRLNLARICYAEAVKIYDEIKSPEVSRAQAELDLVTGVREPRPEMLDDLDFWTLATDVCLGDKVAEARLLPALKAIETAPDVPKQLANRVRALHALLAGERKPSRLLESLEDEDAVQMLLVLLQLSDLRLGEYMGMYVNLISGLIMQEEGSAEWAQSVIEQLETPPYSSDQDNRTLAKILRSIMAGERDPVSLTAGLQNPLVARCVRKVLELHKANPSMRRRQP